MKRKENLCIIGNNKRLVEGDRVNTDFYTSLNLKYKQKQDIPDVWDRLINQVDEFIIDFLGSFGIEVDILYTTNVGLLNVKNEEQSAILWDVSYWSLYLNYLEFVFWMENEKWDLSGELKSPLAMKENIVVNRSHADACRLVFLSTMFEYLSYKFYNDETMSYCFALLHNENKSSMPHRISDDVMTKYSEFLQEQLAMAKLFCAFHEAYHLKGIEPAGDYDDYVNRVMYNIKAVVNSKEFEEYYGYDMQLVKDAQKKVNSLKIEDPLFDELYADAAALDLLDVVLNHMDYFQPKYSTDKFVTIMRQAIENFYSFNTLTYDLYTIWASNLELFKNDITERVYKEDVHIKDVEAVIRGQVFPMILWIQLDRIVQQKGEIPPVGQSRYVNVRKEMTDFFDIAYNDTIKEAVFSAMEQGFRNTKLSITEARDILIGWGILKIIQAFRKKIYF